jgi:ATP phosphoribosyltransferase regulatory subunit HisZ
MKKVLMILLAFSLVFGLAFTACGNSSGIADLAAEVEAMRKYAPPKVEVEEEGLEVGDVVLELADLIGDAEVGDELTVAAPITKEGAVTLTVVAVGGTKGVEVSGRTADYHGVNVDLSGLDFAKYEYEVTFAGYTTPAGSAGVKIGQPASPYDDLLALPTVTANTPAVSPATALAPIFGPSPGQMTMRIAAATIPYASGHTNNFTVTEFVIAVKTVK